MLIRQFFFFLVCVLLNPRLSLCGRCRFSGDAICVLYEPDRSTMAPGALAAAADGSSKKGAAAGSTYADLPAMQHAAYRAVSEGLEALFDDYTVTTCALLSKNPLRNPRARAFGYPAAS
jgi:hypothetical protein